MKMQGLNIQQILWTNIPHFSSNTKYKLIANIDKIRTYQMKIMLPYYFASSSYKVSSTICLGHPKF